ncbi:zf-TFIIB domain-containing protein, partial [Acinetobacter baumannii]
GGFTMNCPHCATRLVCKVQSDVVVETCPQCDGVWLDRGEIEVLLAMSKDSANPHEILNKIFTQE